MAEAKYKKLRHKIAAFTEEQSHQDKLNEWKKIFLGDTTNPEDANSTRLATELVKRNEEADQLELNLKTLNFEMQALSQMIVDCFENEQLEQKTFSNGAVVKLTDSPFPRVVDEEAFEAWGVKKFGRKQWEAMKTKPRLNHNTFKAMVGDALVNGEQLMPGVEVYIKTEAKVSWK